MVKEKQREKLLHTLWADTRPSFSSCLCASFIKICSL